MSKYARTDQNADTVMAAQLATVIAFSTCYALAKFEQTSASCRRQVMRSMRYHETIKKSTLVTEAVRSSAKSCDYPNSTILHFAELQKCMICKDVYYGGLHPDFGICVHAHCLTPLYVTYTQLYTEQYPMQDLVRTVALTTTRKIMKFIRYHKAGFPEMISIEKWETAFNGRKEYMYDRQLNRMLEYNVSNSNSTARVKKEKLKIWMTEMKAAMADSGFKGKSLDSLIMAVPQEVRKLTRDSVMCMRDLTVPVEQLAAQAINVVKIVQDVLNLWHKGLTVVQLQLLLESAEAARWLELVNLTVILPTLEREAVLSRDSGGLDLLSLAIDLNNMLTTDSD